MIPIGFDGNAIYIGNLRLPIVAGTLVATANGDMVSVTSLHSTQVVVANNFSQISDLSGQLTFTSAADCVAYLNAQFQMRRSIDIPTATGVASSDILAGMPVAVLRTTQQLAPARADTYALAFVAGLAASKITSGFVGNATRNAITLPDWTSVAGASALQTGQPYFLAPTGGITLQAPTSPTSVCSVRVGLATAPQTILFVQADPITL